MDGNNRDSEPPQVKVGSVYERDIDFLLVEEFYSSRDFLDWFVQQVNGEQHRLKSLISVERSAFQFTGESDVELFYLTGEDQVVAILIENKINAGLQKDQAERYLGRGEAYINDARCVEFLTVLVAPEAYFRSKKVSTNFDATLSYEAIKGWFDAHHINDPRVGYKVQMIEAALEKASLGYQMEADACMSTFWHWYWEQSCIHALELEMNEPGGKPSGSTFIYFRPPGMTKECNICHKFVHGTVDLQISGLGPKLNTLRSLNLTKEYPNVKLTRAGGAAAFRIEVPVLDPQHEFEKQKHALLRCFEAALSLLNLYRSWNNRIAEIQP